MKRLLYISLGVLVISANIQAREWDYFAVYKNPTGLKGWEQLKTPKGELRVPAFSTASGVKVGQNIQNEIVYSTFDIIAALKLPESTDYSIKELPMAGQERQFQICIKKVLLPKFNPKEGKNARFGIQDAAKVEDKGDMWCFTLIKNKGYSKLLVDR